MSIPKIISIWLAALVIAGGSLFVYKNYFVKDLEKNAERITDPTLSEVEEWKTYRNEKYGFEIKYPFYFEIESTTTSKLLLRTGDKKGSIDIRAYENPNMHTSIHVYCESLLGKNALFCNDINNWEKVKAEIRVMYLNDIEITSISKKGSASTTSYFIKDKLVYEFSYTSIDTSEIEKIILDSTFPDKVKLQTAKEPEIFIKSPNYGQLEVYTSRINAGRQYNLTFGTYIPDPTLIRDSVLLHVVDENGDVVSTSGKLNDDGINGDEKKGDKSFAGTFDFYPKKQDINLIFRASAKFRNVEGRLMSGEGRVYVYPPITDHEPEEIMSKVKNIFVAATSTDSLVYLKPYFTERGIDQLGLNGYNNAELIFQVSDRTEFEGRVEVRGETIVARIIMERTAQQVSPGVYSPVWKINDIN